MKRKLAAMVMAAMATAAVAAGPASANDWNGWNDRNDRNGHDWNDRHDDDFFGYPYVAVVDDVEYENVRERNDRDGECRVEDLDLDGFIAEYELVCYY
jgi:opacity protein-like surface antigen